MALIVLGLLIHLGFGSLLTFSVDEAHYALYAAKPALSYFDHPPLVGWIQWPLVAMASPDWVIRLIPQALWLISTYLAWHLAETLRLLIPDWRNGCKAGEAGRWAVLMIMVGPVFHVLAVGLLPDTLLMALTLALMLTTLRLTQDPTMGRWLILGVLLGLAGLSKYTAVLVAVAVAVMLILNLGWRVLARPGLWLAALIAGAMVSPVFIWNATHEWISFQYQIAHSSGGSWRAYRLAAFIGLQLVAFGPLALMAAVMCARTIWQHPQRQLIGLSLFFLLPFLVTAYMSGGGRTLPHWMAPAWLAAIALGANPIAMRWATHKRKVLTAFASIQAVMCTVAFAALFFIGIPGVSHHDALGKKNPLADLWGWDQAGQLAQQLAREHELPTLVVSNWTLASRLAWYAKPEPVVVLDDRVDQFDLWWGKLAPGQSALFVNWSQVPYQTPVGPKGFVSCSRLADLPIERLGRDVSAFEFYDCRQWQGQ
jgi:4-amino-4-deoxy-L-arabinose transferase-like glycosyltransferase